MKKAIMIFALATCIGVNGFSQQNVGTLPTNILPSTTPANISQLETRVRLITQNFYNVPTPTQTTGNFGTAARWNSMGSLNAGSQVLNGFRTQTNGRGLTLGYSTLGVTLANPTGTNTNLPSNNPTIQWIGNAAGASVTPGNLEFKYAENPGSPGSPQNDVKIFTMAPAFTIPSFPPINVPAFCYAETNTFIGQKESGTFGLFGLADTWSATGKLTLPALGSITSYGSRHQYEGYNYNAGFIKSGTNVTAIQDFGNNDNVNGSIDFRFRSSRNPSDPTTIKNIWQSSNKFNNIVFGRKDYGALNPDKYYMGLFDGDGPSTGISNVALSAFERAGIYATTNTRDYTGGFVNNYASVVGDITEYETALASQTSFRTAILGIGTQNLFTFNPINWAGYFLGDVGYTGQLIQVSDKKFKIKVEDEVNIIDKLMQLKPKNYFFDRDNFKNMTFNNKLQHGLISQDVELVFPELVTEATGPGESKDGKVNIISYKGLNYMGFIPMLLKGIQELKVENDALKTRLEVLETTSSTNTFVLNDKTNLPAEIENKAFTLSQNTPNPFSEKTTISYTIPSNVKKATLAVFDLTGKMLLQYNLVQGKNQLTINGSTLPAGMYLYSLLADGQEVLSKRMILTK